MAATLVPNAAQFFVNLALAAAFTNYLVEFPLSSRAYFHLRAVVEQNPKFFDVVHRFAAEQRMRPARIVPNHPANRAAVMRRGIRPKRQPMSFCTIAQGIEHHPRLDSGDSTLRIDFQDSVHV